MDVGLKNRHNIKIFANMIHCLAKVGEEVIFDMKADRVSFVTVNASKSTFARFTLLHSFFDTYKLLHNAPKIVRLTLKNIVHVFKNANNVDQLKVTLEKNTNQIVFDSFGLSQVQKIYHINCSPCDVVNPEHDLSRDFEFVVNSSYLSNLLSPFGKLAGDITFLLGKRIVVTTSQPNQPNLSQVDGRFTQYYIQMKSYAERGEKQNGNQTSLAIDTVNLESFNVAQQLFVQNEASNRPTPPAGTVTTGSEQTIQAESEMTFSFKDLKAMIGFCELSEFNIDFSMTRNRGDPIVIKSESPNKDVEVVFLMATVDSDDDPMATTETSTITSNQQQEVSRQEQANNNQMVDEQFSGDQFSTPINNKRKRTDLDDSSIYIDNQDRFVTPEEVVSNPSGKSIHNQFLNEDMPCASFGLNGENERYVQLGVAQSFSSNSSNNDGSNNEYGVQDDSEGMVAQRHVLSNASDEEVAGTPSPPTKHRKR